MATIRVTRELLEHILDLPEGVEIVDVIELRTIQNVPVIELLTTATGLAANGPFATDSELALQYEETETGVHLVGVLPVE